MALQAQAFQILLYQSHLRRHLQVDHACHRLVAVSPGFRVVVGGFLDFCGWAQDYQAWLEYAVQQDADRAEAEALRALIDDWLSRDPGPASPIYLRYGD